MAEQGPLRMPDELFQPLVRAAHEDPDGGSFWVRAAKLGYIITKKGSRRQPGTYLVPGNDRLKAFKGKLETARKAAAAAAHTAALVATAAFHRADVAAAWLDGWARGVNVNAQAVAPVAAAAAQQAVAAPPAPQSQVSFSPYCFLTPCALPHPSSVRTAPLPPPGGRRLARVPHLGLPRHLGGRCGGRKQ